MTTPRHFPTLAALLAVLSACSDDDTSSADIGVDTGADDVAAPDAWDDPSVDAPVDDGSGDGGEVYSVRYLYDPLGDVLTTLPDDAFTVADASTATGLVVRLDDRLPWYAASTGLPRGAFDALDGLDGWGTNAALAVVFDGQLGTLPSGVPASVESDALQLLRLDDDGVVRLPYEIQRLEDGGILVVPMLPLEPAARHALVGTGAIRAADGGPIDPGPALRALLRGEATGDLARMNARYAELLDATGLAADDVAFAVAFTTQSTLDGSRAVAARIREMEFAWAGARDCATQGTDPVLVHCEGAFDAWSWRDEAGAMGDGEPVRQYRLRVSAWLPDSEGPHPVAIFGHGLVHGRDVAGTMANLIGPLGIAVIAIDAVAHGEHPDAPDDDAMVLFDFFGVSLDPIRHDALRLRDNFRQSTWDKLQLLRLLELDPDVDGDGTSDLDLDRMAYVGESFGGIMAIELLALTNRFQVAALQLGGGAVTRIISDAERFSTFTLLAGGAQDPSATARFFPMVQAAVDAGDASTWAPWVLQRRLPEIGGPAPHLMLQLVIDDNTVPDSSSDSVVRALGLEHMPPVARVIPGTETTAAAPVAGNLADGQRTGVVFQFDRIRRNPTAAVERASHDYMPSSIEGEHQVREFLQAWVEGEIPAVVDPYVDLDTPPVD